MKTTETPTETKHTPGPWKTHRMVANGHFRINTSDDSLQLAHIYSTAGEEQSRANARLIAASPDLLAALERFARYAASHVLSVPLQDIADAARAAIAKARQ